jgi:hypothetical protein
MTSMGIELLYTGNFCPSTRPQRLAVCFNEGSSGFGSPPRARGRSPADLAVGNVDGDAPSTS